MDGARQHFLAGAALAADQHAGVGSGDHARLGQQFRHLRAAKDDAGQPCLGTQLAVAACRRRRRQFRRRKLQGKIDFLEQDLTVERLGQITENAARSRVDRIGNRAVRGKQNDRQGRPRRADFLEQGEAVAARQAHVADHDARRIDGDAGQRILGRTHRTHAKAARLQAHGEQPQNILVIIDDQDVRSGRHFARPGSVDRRPRGRCGRVRSISARPSSFSCNSLLLR